MSAEYLLEHVVLPAQVGIEESGGFSAPDPQKVSLRGASVLWTRWSLDGFDLGDPLFPGASVLRAPFRFLSGIAVGADGVELSSGASGTAAGVMYVLPELGGIFPGGKEITRAFSSTHPTDRSPAPPEERRRFDDRLRLWAAGSSGEVTYAADLERGHRRFLGFDSPEGYWIASGALRSGDVYLLGEYRQRDHLFAELHYGPEETAEFDRGVILAAIRGDHVRAAVTLQRATIRHDHLEFVRELIDRDGEGYEPYFPDGDLTAGRIELGYEDGPWYLEARADLLQFSPSTTRWTNALTVDGVPMGHLEHESRETLELLAEPRAGLRGNAKAGDLEIDYRAELSLAAADRLFLPDFAGSLTAKLAWRSFVPFASISKTPIPIDGALVRTLDPDWLDSRIYSAGGALIDHQGGANLDVAADLARANIYTAALGFAAHLGDGWRLESQGVFRAFHHPYRIELEGDAGYFVDGRFYFRDGSHRYRLTNDDGLPFYAGFELQLTRVVEGRFLLSAGFTAYTTVAHTAFGNGPTANDPGVVSFSTANPNTSIGGLASTDGDRAFAFKALAGARIYEGWWIFATARHKDGQPFAFTEVTTNDGQAALAHTSSRGSPLHPSRPLLGPREDFQLELDLELQYRLALESMQITGRAWITNVFDLGNELAELHTAQGRATRAAFELQIPRALFVSAEVAF